MKYGRAKISALAVVCASLVAGISIAGQQWGWGQLPRPATLKGSDLRQEMGDYDVKNPAGYRAASSVRATNDIIVILKKGESIEALASKYNLQILRQLKSDKNSFVVRSQNGAADAVLVGLQKNSGVRAAQLDQVGAHAKFQFVPNDPYYNFNNPAGFPGQWYLQNGMGGTIDARVPTAWNYPNGSGGFIQNLGATVIVGVVDDGLERTHADLTGNYNAAESFDFGQGDADPLPVNSDDNHGTSVAGIIAARGGNGVGITGVAPQAGLAGLRVDFLTSPTSHFVDATTFHSSGGNTNIKVKNHSYGYVSNFANASTEVTALNTSTTAGTVHVFAAGNSRGTAGQDANKQMLQASPDAITVAAVSADGVFAPYSNFGANVFVSAPSSGYFNPETGESGGTEPVTTTDRTGALGYNPLIDTFPDTAYTSQFGGTSAAAPIVTGAVVLAKRNLAIPTRGMKHLLVRSARIVNPRDRTISSDGGWKTNGAGFKFNQNYGFGLIDAAKLQKLASQYVSVSAAATTVVGSTSVASAIPDNNATGISRTFNIVSTAPLEEVLVDLNITHTYRGDLEATLTSPSGTSSRLFIRSATDGGQDIVWKFTSNAFWGENPAGTWTLKVADVYSADTGTWNNYGVTLRQGTIQLNDAEYVSQVVPDVMVAGTSTPVQVNMKNTGTIQWTQAGNHRLASETNTDNTTWGFNRVLLGGAETVNPGQTKNWAFNVTPPATPGTYNFNWRMCQTGGARFGDFTENKEVLVVASGDASQFVSQNVPAVMSRNAQYLISITYKNVGSTTWKALDLYRLGSWNPVDNTTWGGRRAYMSFADQVLPGQTYTFFFSIQTPLTPGTYNFQWRTLHDGVAHFGPATPNVAVTVT
jgi:subtilisin-like proprotein convertase family protein